MGMSAGGAAEHAGKRRHRRRPVMAEINVTPMVDVMLVLLIIFMISAPMLVGVPIDFLPQTEAKRLDQDKQPLTIRITGQNQVFLQETEIKLDELVPKLKAVMSTRDNPEERIEIYGEREARYEIVAKVSGMLQRAGFLKINYRHLPE
jgi:biopolymer transport protein TolR